MADKYNRKSGTLIKNTITLYVRMVLSMLIGFFTSRILLNQLGVQDFGLYNVIAGILIILGFLNTTLTLSTQRFLNFSLGEKSMKNAQKVFSTSVVIHSLLALIILVVAETIGLWFLNNQMNIPLNRIEAANLVYQTTIVATMLQICQVPFVASIIAHERMSQYASICIIDIILRFLSALTLTYISYDKLKVYSILILLVAIVNILMYVIYSVRNFDEISLKFNKEISLYKKMLQFSGWNIFSAISISINGQVINVLLNIFFGPIVNAARGVSTQASGAINGLVGNFQVAVNPEIIKLYAAQEYDNYMKLIKRSAKFSYFLLLIIALPISFRMNDVLELWLVNVPIHTPIFCILILTANLINTFSLPLATAANATGKIKKFQLYTGVLELFNIPMSLIFLQLGCPPYMVFVVNIVITICTLFIRMVTLKSLIQLNITDFITTVIMKAFIVTFISVPFIYILSICFTQNDIINVCLYLCSSILVILLIIYIVGLNREEKLFVVEVMKEKLRK